MTKKKKGLVATAIFTLVSILYVSPLVHRFDELL